MSLSRAAAQGGLVTAVTQVASVAVRLVSLVVLARLLAPEVFGIVSITSAISTFAATVVLLGLSMAAVQAERLSQNAKSLVFFLNLALGLVLALILVAAAGPLATAYDQPVLADAMRWLALVPLLSGLQGQHRIALMRDFRFGTLNLIELVSQVLTVLLAIGLALAGYTYLAVVAQVVSQPVLQLLALVRTTRWRPSIRVRWDHEVNALVAVGMRVFGMNTLRNLARSALVPLAGLAVTPTALGHFDRAQQLCVMPINILVDQLQRVAVPTLSRLRGEPTRLFGFFRTGHRITAYVCFTLFFGLAALGDRLVPIALGPGWELAGTVLQVLALGAGFRAVAQSTNWLFVATEQTRAGLVLSVWTQPAIVLISLAGLPWGVVGLAVANSVAWFLYWPVSVVTAARAAGASPRPLLFDSVRAVLLFAGPAAVVASVAARPLAADWAGLLVGVAAGVVTGGACLALFRSTRADLLHLAGTLRLAVSRA